MKFQYYKSFVLCLTALLPMYLGCDNDPQPETYYPYPWSPDPGAVSEYNFGYPGGNSGIVRTYHSPYVNSSMGRMNIGFDLNSVTYEYQSPVDGRPYSTAYEREQLSRIDAAAYKEWTQEMHEKYQQAVIDYRYQKEVERLKNSYY